MKTFIVSYFLIFVTACNNTTEKIIQKWPNGQKKVTYTIFVGDTSNLLDVSYKAYYPNGQIFKTGQIKNGLEVGQWAYYYQSGRLKSNGQFIEGRMDGDFETYYESGEVEQKGKYSRGQLLNLLLFNRDGTTKKNEEDLTMYLVDNPQKWTTNQTEEIRIDCLMAIEPGYNNAAAFCDCILDSLQKHCNYSDIKRLTENQRGIILNYITHNQKECFNLLKKRNPTVNKSIG
jgi:Uncharacterized protein conserved in bacteria